MPDPTEMSLHTSWKMYFTSKKKANKGQKIPDYKEGRQEYPEIITIADFWMTVNHIPLPSELMVGFREDLMFFRGFIQPEWEDAANKDGGMFRLELTDKELRNKMLNHFWMEILMAIVGEQFTDANLITGCVLQRRQKYDRIHLWTRKIDDRPEDEANTIKKRMACQFREFLGVDTASQIQYIMHAENNSWSGSGGG